MKKFIKSFREFKQAKKDFKYLEANHNIYLCWNPALNQFFCSVYFSVNYIVRVQKSEVVFYG